MHEVYALIREKSGALFSDDNHLLYIATPSGWDEKAKNLYGQMAAKAGLPIAGITSESRAAFIPLLDCHNIYHKELLCLIWDRVL